MLICWSVAFDFSRKKPGGLGQPPHQISKALTGTTTHPPTPAPPVLSSKERTDKRLFKNRRDSPRQFRRQLMERRVSNAFGRSTVTPRGKLHRLRSSQGDNCTRPCTLSLQYRSSGWLMCGLLSSRIRTETSGSIVAHVKAPPGVESRALRLLYFSTEVFFGIKSICQTGFILRENTRRPPPAPEISWTFGSGNLPSSRNWIVGRREGFLNISVSWVGRKGKTKMKLPMRNRIKGKFEPHEMKNVGLQQMKKALRHVLLF